jgi:hypothetical protein
MRWTWSTSDRPLGADDREALAPDLAALGADGSLLTVFDATVRAGGPVTRPLWLVARRADDSLVGAVLVVMCRDSGVSFFGAGAPRLRRLVRAGPALWYWDRTSLGADGVSMPGLVAPGVRREELVRRAIDHLSRRTYGALIDSRTPDVPHVAQRPFIGACSVVVPAHSRDELLSRHRNLARKLRRFAGRGGTIETLDGPMPASLRRQLVAGYEIERPINPPFVERYRDMVEAHWSLPGDGLRHLVARLDGEPVGYHTFWQAGGHLAMLSGVVARPPGGSVHAYENLMVASLELAAARGCRRVDFGLAVNAAKTAMLGRTPNDLHLVSRVAPVRGTLRMLVPRTRLAHAALEQATGPLGV